jgi:hypothetical protein
VILPSCIGTLKSTLTSTRLPLRSTSVIDNLFAIDMVVDDDSQGRRGITSVDLEIDFDS